MEWQVDFGEWEIGIVDFPPATRWGVVSIYDFDLL